MKKETRKPKKAGGAGKVARLLAEESRERREFFGESGKKHINY